jgi:DNA-binding transcriptional ArsR family regulator
VFAALGDPTRLEVVARLAKEGPMSIAKLTHGTGVTRQAVTKHLRLMERARLVRGKRHGRERLWTVNESRVDEARRYLDRVSAEWDQALARLTTTVES